MLNERSSSTNLSITDPVIMIFINFTYHCLESQVSLRTTEFLHHVLQFIKVNEFVLVEIVAET
jgi:hypothetical protein